MSKLRVYEYAKNNSLESKTVINALKEMNVSVSNHMSTISDDVQKKLDQKLKKKNEPANKQTSQRNRPKQNNNRGGRNQRNKKR